MKTHPREEALRKHYEKNVTYQSPVGEGKILRVLKLLKVNPRNYFRVLDLGCGDGRFSRHLATEYNRVCRGVDYCKGRIRQAMALSRSISCEFICGDLYQYLLTDMGPYDMIALFAVLEHLEEPKLLVDMCRERVSDKGVIIGAVPLKSRYKAHIQYFENRADVEKKTGLKVVAIAGGVAYLREG